MTSTNTLTLRWATPADAVAVADLAALDSAAALDGTVLLAEVSGRPVAALSLIDGRAVADPFVPTERVVALLRLAA